MMAERRWQVLPQCGTVIASTGSQVWDPDQPDRRLDNGSTDIDTADAEEYSWSAWLPYLVRSRTTT